MDWEFNMESVDGFIHQLWKSYSHDALRAYNLSFLTVFIFISNANDEHSDEKRERWYLKKYEQAIIEGLYAHESCK